MFDDFVMPTPTTESVIRAPQSQKMAVVTLKPPLLKQSIVLLPNVEKFPDGKVLNHIYLFGTIGGSRDYTVDMASYHYVYNALITATDNDVFKIFIDTPGGDVTLMAHLISGIQQTRAKVITVAAGYVMSAGGPLWAAGHEREILDHAIFMFHFSSHGDGGSTGQIAATAAELQSYISAVMLPLLEIGVVTQDEINTALSRSNVYISAFEARRRVEEKATRV